MLTYVVDEMPSKFWNLLNDSGLLNNFVTNAKGLETTIEIIIIRTRTIVDAEFLSRYPHLRLIIRAGTGFDNIDISAARNRGISVVTTPEANAPSAYEQTLMMILALIKNVNIAAANLKMGKWKNQLLPSLEISDLRVLIVGLGRIGKRVNRTLQYLGAQVKGVDPYIPKEEWQENNIASCNYIEGISWSNIISYHCPLTSETYHYFGNKELSLIKSPMFIINVARGGIVDEKSLLKGLKSGKIVGAGLDVLEEEPSRAIEFQSYSEVILSPHIGAYTLKSKERLAEETLKTWKEFMEKGVIRNVVNSKFEFSPKKD